MAQPVPGSPEWHAANKSCARCELPHRQSPINLKKGSRETHQFQWQYHPSHEVVLNLGHTVELKYDEGSGAIFDGESYQLVQMHFHTPSEHWVRKQRYPMEAHLVHQAKNGHYLVLAVLFTSGNSHPFLETFIGDIPKNAEAIYEKDKNIDIRQLLPTSPAFYTYSGSLTTPPYTEGVRWVVFQAPVAASKAQIEAIQSVEGFNARTLQKVYHRRVAHFRRQE
ncbi:MAG: carbonic anhydrase family protein [Microscillaceae bacterium]